MAKLLFSLSIITFGLIIGYLIQRLTLKGIIKADKTLSKERRILQAIALLVLFPISTVGALWDFAFNDLSIVFLPLVGVLTLFAGGFSSLLLTKILKYNNKQAGAFFSCCSMSNIGSTGALIVFVFLGEKAFALVPIYKLFEQVIYYALWFPVAKSFSSTMKTDDTKNRFVQIIKDPYVLVAIISVIVGVILNLLKIPRPTFYSQLNAVIIPIGSLMLLSSIGMAMKFSKIKNYLKPAALIAMVKFILMPVVATSVAYLLGFNNIDNGLPLKVVLILSSVPVGFIALVPPTIYDLDLDLANAGWFITTVSLVIVIPLQMLFISFI
jgi:hypothetical protein